jgi:hypothetical protein
MAEWQRLHDALRQYDKLPAVMRQLKKCLTVRAAVCDAMASAGHDAAADPSGAAAWCQLPPAGSASRMSGGPDQDAWLTGPDATTEAKAACCHALSMAMQRVPVSFRACVVQAGSVPSLLKARRRMRAVLEGGLPYITRLVAESKVVSMGSVVSLVTEENPSFFCPSGTLLIRVRTLVHPWPHAHAVPPAQAEGGVEQLEQCVGELLEGLMGPGGGWWC